MDRNTSLERRFSLNATHIANPIAESTCLNINNRSTPTSFQWGGTPISPKNRSNSSICLSSNTKSNQYNRSSIHNSNRSISSRSNSTIDPRVYADVQSKGLASRIVKYHEKGTCLSRSFSVNNLYSKPGQFPVVNLKKTDLPQRVSFTKLSMTRIAPPEKSMFYGNTLPSVLRSNSVVAMHKSDEEISSENRPILHPPPTENEMAPTRSVLEVLKEISRKRINSDHLDLEDGTKKYCNREINEQTCVTNAQQNNKRQREHINGQNQFVQAPQQPTNYLTTQHSPEHLAKKRLCSYNNDITSSLSSSQIHANKRKLYEHTGGLLQDPLTEEVHHRSTKKFQLQQRDSSSKQYLTTPNKKSSSNCTIAEQSYDEDIVEKNAIAGPTRQVNAPQLQHDTNKLEIVNSNINDSIKKKKLTLFNKDYDEAEQKALDQFADNGPAENGDFCGIPFVKPKKNTSSSVAKNPIIERTQKSKLALMLSGLRGDLYPSDEHQVDEAKKEDTIKVPSETENKAATAPLALLNAAETPSISGNKIKSISNLSSENATTKSSIVSESFAKPVSTLLNLAASSVASELDTQSKASTAMSSHSAKKEELHTVSNTNYGSSSKINMTQSPLVGIKLTPQSTTPSTFLNTTNVSIESSTKNPPTLKFNTKPIVSVASSSSGGFSFNLIPTAVTATTVTGESQKLQPKIGLLNSTSLLNSTTANGFAIPVTTSTSSFGQTAQLGIQSATPFTFGSLASSTADTRQSVVKTSDFNAVKSINFAEVSTAAAVPAVNTKPFGFASISSANTVTEVPSSTNNGFSFGIKNTNAQKPSAVATPFAINSSGLTQQPLQKPVNCFTFDGSTNSSGLTTSGVKPGQISFGETTTSTNTNSLNFGGAATTNAPFSFGSNFTATSSQAKTLDTSSKTGPFTFGGNSTASTNTNKNDGFAFESATTSTTSDQTSTNIFGSSTIQPSTVTPSFSFGETDRPATITSPSSSNIFGTSAIAGANPQNKSFAFGSSINSITSPKSETGGFSFNTANKSNSGGFSFSTNTASDAGQTPSTLPPFRFGSLASNGGSNNGSKPFQGQSAELFDSSLVLNKITAPPPFSFTANASNAQTNGNTFAPPQQNTIAGIGDRPFRRATRRLPKS